MVSVTGAGAAAVVSVVGALTYLGVEVAAGVLGLEEVAFGYTNH